MRVMNTAFVRTLALISPALWLFAAAGANAATDANVPLWGSLGGGPQRMGLSTLEGPSGLQVQRTFETPAPVQAGVALDGQGRMYVACLDGKLYCRKAEGSLEWTYDANSPITSAPTLGPDGTIVVGCESGVLHAVSPAGIPKWKYPTGGALGGSAAVTPKGILVFGSNDGYAYAVDGSGRLVWKYQCAATGPLPAAILASPAVAHDGTIYLGTAFNPRLYALAPENGAVKWTCRFRTGTGLVVSPVVGEAGAVYVTVEHDDHLYAVSQEDGAILWTTALADPAQGWYEPDPNVTRPASNEAGGWSEPVLGPDGTIYVSLGDPYLRAVSPNGALKWGLRLGDSGSFTLTVGKEGRVYAASEGGHLYIVSPDGKIIASTVMTHWVSRPVVGPGRTVIVSDPTDHGLQKGARNRVLILGAATTP